MAATVAALKQLPTIAHQTANTDLVSVVGELDQLAALGTAGVVTMTAEAEQRGVINESQCASTAAWIRDAAWHLQCGGSGVVAKCVSILRRHDLAMLVEAIQTTDVTPIVAATIAAEFDKISPDLADGAGPPVLDAMIGAGADHGPRMVKQLRQHLLARYGLDGAFQDEQDSKRRYVELSAGSEGNGVFHYDLTLDAEGRAVLEWTVPDSVDTRRDSCSS
ncbi:MAG: hypothetical protein ACR2P2_13255 [Nakamurella sp.]